MADLAAPAAAQKRKQFMGEPCAHLNIEKEGRKSKKGLMANKGTENKAQQRKEHEGAIHFAESSSAPLYTLLLQ